MCYFLVTRKSTEGRPSNGKAFTSIFEMKIIIFFALKMLLQFSINDVSTYTLICWRVKNILQ